MFKKYLIINYPDLNIGGIQRIIYNYFNTYVSKGYIGVWITHDFPDYDEGFKDIIENIMIVKKRYAKDFFSSMTGEDFSVILSFDLPNFVFNQVLVQEFSLNSKNFLIVPNLVGNGIRLENSDDLNAFDRLSVIYNRLYNNGNVLFCDPNQEISLVEHYKIEKINKFQNNIIPYKVDIIAFDEKQVESHYKSNNIITVSRFDFPHKAYLIGLIKAYEKMKLDYPELKLIVIGDGNGADEIKHAIVSCKHYARKDIVLVGTVPYNELPAYFIDAKVFIGLAGSVYDAVKCGLPAIITRHYSYECDAYGYYHDNYQKVVSTIEGVPVSYFISDVMSMSFDEYSSLAKKEYDTFYKLNNTSNSIFFEDRIMLKEIFIEQDELCVLKNIIDKYIKNRTKKRNEDIIKNPVSSIIRFYKRLVKNLKLKKYND